MRPQNPPPLRNGLSRRHLLRGSIGGATGVAGLWLLACSSTSCRCKTRHRGRKGSCEGLAVAVRIPLLLTTVRLRYRAAVARAMVTRFAVSTPQPTHRCMPSAP